MSKLREKMLMDLQLKGYSPRTQKLYIDHVKRYAVHFSKCPSALGNNEIRTYLHYLIAEKKLSSSYINSAYIALKFLYTITLDQK